MKSIEIKKFKNKIIKRDTYYTRDRNAMGILKFNNDEVYLGIFNLSNKKKKIRWKFYERGNKHIKGLGRDVFTETLFFINDGEICIDSLMPNDCYIIKIN